MSHQLQLLNGFMESNLGEIIDAVMGIPPDPYMPVIDALNAIGYVMSNESPEGGISDVVQAYLNEYFPAGMGIEPNLTEFYNALIQFSGNADIIIENVDDYIKQITSGSIDCSRFTSEQDCLDAGVCTWIDNIGCTDMQP